MSGRRPEFQKEHFVHLTLACNDRCVFCTDGDRMDGSLRAFDEIRSDLKAGRRAGVGRARLSGGGEPTLHPRFVDVVAAAKAEGYAAVGVTTNGRRFSRKDLLAGAVEAGLDAATFSIHGHTPELHDELVGHRGSFEEAIEGLRNALGFSGLRVNVQMVLNRKNAPFAGDMHRFFKGLGVPDVAFKQLMPHGSAWPRKDELFPAPGDGWLNLWELFERSPDPSLRAMARDYLAVHVEQTYSTMRGGMAPYMEAFVERGEKPWCWGERCAVCPMSPVCSDVDELHRSGRLEAKAAEPACAPGGPVPAPAAEYPREGARLDSFLAFHASHRWRFKAKACAPCPHDAACAGAPLAGILRRGFPAPPLRDGEYLQNGRRKFKNVELNPGRLCNNKCVFCMSGEERDEHEPWAAPERMKAEILSHYEAGARSLGFLGGEPSAYPHLLECMRYAKELGYQRIALCTNGTRLANPRFLEQCLEAGLTRVTMSLHSHVPEIEAFLVGVPGILNKKLQAIKNLVAAREAGRLPDNVSLNPVLCRPNAPHIEAFARFFKPLGIDDIRFNFIWPESRVKLDKNVVPRLTEVVPHVLSLIVKNEKELRMTLSFGAMPVCVLPEAVRTRKALLEKYFFDEALDLPTDVSFLHAASRGSTVERFNWHRRGRDEYRGKVDACRTCRFDAACMGVYRSYLSLYGEGEFGDRR